MTVFVLGEAAALPPSLVDQAHEVMRRKILDNQWSPGFQALEQEVALSLGMSRTPVREALIRLQQEGFVAVIPRRGFRVLPVSPTDMKEIYEILTALECMAVELVARRKPSQAELKPLVSATREMTAALSRDDLEKWALADETFHHALVKLSGNKLLLEAAMGFWDRAHRARMFTLRLRPKPTNSTKEHMSLVAKMAEGDVPGAVEVNRFHRERASRELIGIFEQFRLQQL
jgi:DNA-binding GntR family transcriptional regulator